LRIVNHFSLSWRSITPPISAKIYEDVFWEWEQRKDRFWVQLANQGIKL